MRTYIAVFLCLSLLPLSQALARTGWAEGKGANETQACANAKYRAEFILGKGKGVPQGECTCDYLEGQKVSCYIKYSAPDEGED